MGGTRRHGASATTVDHGPPFALLLAVDDATGIVVNALFCEQENTRDPC